MERPHHKESICEIWKPYLLWFKSYGNIKFLGMKVKGHGEGHKVKKLWYERKSLITRNVHVKYVSSTCNSSKVMAYIAFSGMKVKGHGQGRKVKRFGMNRKASSQGVYM